MTNIAVVQRSGHITTALAHDLGGFECAASASFVPLRVSNSGRGAFRGRIRDCSLGELSVSEINAAGHAVERTSEHIRQTDRPYYKVSLLLAGRGVLIQDGREAHLGPGDLAIYDTRRPYSLEFDEPFRSAVVMVPPSLIDLPPNLVSQLTAVPLSARDGVGTMIVPFLTRMAANLEQLQGATGVRVAHAAMGLVTAMLAAELGEGRASRKQDLLRRIHGYIEAHLACSDLGPARIAGAHYISTRHLHTLFRADGVTVSAWIRQRRLEHCRRELMDPIYADHTVSAIIAKWGFTDAAYFSRAFKSEYGHSPSELRPAPRSLSA